MLTALHDDGSVISLADREWTPERLQHLRKCEHFFCRDCHEPLCLKMGTHRRPHFAHYAHARCISTYEPESQCHIDGKIALLNWCLAAGHKAKLEHWLPAANQRPDIYLPGIEPFALEYQCSAISEELLLARTTGYLHIGVQPLWIFGDKRCRKWGQYLMLTAMETAALRASPCADSTSALSSPYYLCYYNPVLQRFSFYTQLYAISESQFITREINQLLHTSTTHQLHCPQLGHPTNRLKEQLLAAKRKFRLQSKGRTSQTERWLREQLYYLHIPFSQFTPYAGLPAAQYIHFRQPPWLWQTWVCCILNQARRPLTPAQMIQLTAAKGGSSLFAMRCLPLVAACTAERLIADYLRQLARLKLVMASEGAFQARAVRAFGAWPLANCFREDQRLLDQLME
ncbi:MAG: competence protein CoiA family protein [Sporolactobacillus sp.]